MNRYKSPLLSALSVISHTWHYCRDYSQTECYLPHKSCNPGLCCTGLMTTVLVLHHNNLQKHWSPAAIPWQSVMLHPDKHRDHIVLQGVTWPDWRIQGFSIGYSRTEPVGAANNLILTDFMGIVQAFFWLCLMSPSRLLGSILWCGVNDVYILQICKHRHEPRRRSSGAVWRTPASVAAWWSDCGTALPPVANTHTHNW